MQLHPYTVNGSWYEPCACDMCLVHPLRMQFHGLALVELAAGHLLKSHPHYSRGRSLMEALRICYPGLYDEAAKSGITASSNSGIKAWRKWLRERFEKRGNG